MKYDTQAMAEVLCKTAGVEYSSGKNCCTIQMFKHKILTMQIFGVQVWLSLQKCVRSWKNDNVLPS